MKLNFLSYEYESSVQKMLIIKFMLNYVFLVDALTGFDAV